MERVEYAAKHLIAKVKVKPTRLKMIPLNAFRELKNMFTYIYLKCTGCNEDGEIS